MEKSEDNKISEENLQKGFFLLSRSIFESDLWYMPPDYLKVWVYIIGKANHRRRKICGHECERGQYFCDYAELAAQLRYRVGYRKSTVHESYMKNLMKFLRDTLRITTVKKPRGILINVLNYDKYQSQLRYEKTTEKTDEETDEKPSENQTSPSINKNYKELEELKNTNDGGEKIEKKKRRAPSREEHFVGQPETDALFAAILLLCEEYKLVCNVNKRALDVVVNTYLTKIQMKQAVKDCCVWLISHGHTNISAPRINNWFKKALQIQKSNERENIERLQQRKLKESSFRGFGMNRISDIITRQSEVTTAEESSSEAF